MFRVLVICCSLILTNAVQANNNDSSKNADKKKVDREHASLYVQSDNYHYYDAITNQSDVKSEVTKVLYTTDDISIVKKFCSNLKSRYTTDAIAINRELTQKELSRCEAHGVNDLIQIKLGEEVIVFAADKSVKALPLKRKFIWRAFAADIFEDENDGTSSVIDNSHKKWSDLDKSLPGTKIKLVVPEQDTVLYEAFKYVGLQPGCQQYDYITDKKYHRHYRSWYRAYCFNVREDAVIIAPGKKQSNTADRIIASKNAIGVMYYNDWSKVSDRLQALPIEGVLPSLQTIKDGSYLLTRPHFVYVKKPLIDKVSGLKRMVDEMTSASAIGKDGYLAKMGLVQTRPADKVATQVVMPLPEKVIDKVVSKKK